MLDAMEAIVISCGGTVADTQAEDSIYVACRDRFLARRPDLAEQRAFIDKALSLALRPVDEGKLAAMAQSDIEAREKQLALSVLVDSARDHPLILRIEDVHRAGRGIFFSSISCCKARHASGSCSC